MIWELSILCKATALLGVAFAAVGLSARARASRRHLILASSFAALIALPVAAALMPTVTIPVAMAAAPSIATAATPPLVSSERADVLPRLKQDVPRASALRAPATAMMLRTIWLLGAAGILATLAGSLWNVRRLRRSGLPWIAGGILAETIAKEAGLNRKVAVLIHERTAVPAAVGFFRPTILLPPDVRHWAEPDLRRVLIHELEHVRRGDWWIHLAARAVCIAYWFHPLVWLAWRRLGIEAERACDDAVISGMDRADYAEQLVALATRLSSRPPRLALSIANRSDLSMRIGAILNPRQQRGRAGAVAAATTIGIVALVTGTVASLQAGGGQRGPVGGDALSQRPVTKAAAGAGNANLSTGRPVDRINTAGQAARSNRPRPVTPVVSLAIPEPETRSAPAMPSMQPPSPAVGAAAASYVIGVEDVLGVFEWRNADLSVESAVVRPDGKISLPLVGDVQAAGLTTNQLRVSVTESLKRFIESPAITVVVRQINSRRVYIVGQVAKPGAYPLNDSMTVLQLIATAGGLSDFAKKASIVIVRQPNDKSLRLSFDYAAFVSGQQLEQNIQLIPGDTVLVP